MCSPHGGPGFTAAGHRPDWIDVDDHNTADWRILARPHLLIGAEGERDNLSARRTILQMMGRDPYDGSAWMCRRVGQIGWLMIAAMKDGHIEAAVKQPLEPK